MIEEQAAEMESAVKCALPPCDIPHHFTYCASLVFVVMAHREVAVVTPAVWKLRYKAFWLVEKEEVDGNDDEEGD